MICFVGMIDSIGLNVGILVINRRKERDEKM